MLEDDFYRESTQFRLWSFTRVQLAEERRQTNALAAEKIKSQSRSARQNRHHDSTSLQPQQQNGDDASSPGHTDLSDAASTPKKPGDSMTNGVDDIEKALPTPSDELALVNWACSKLHDISAALSTHLTAKYAERHSNNSTNATISIPSAVISTATQLLRRFYLRTSVLTYHPRHLLSTFLLLAAKAEHFSLKIFDIVGALKSSGLEPEASEDSVKAGEFVVLQGVRFCLDVRSASRGLQGGVVEMKRLILRPGGLVCRGERLKGDDGMRRVGKVADQVKSLLRREVGGTDVAFLFTPSQIWLGGVYQIDPDLAGAFIDAKLEEIADKAPVDFKARLLSTIQSCAEEIASYEDSDDKPQRKVLSRVNKKVLACQAVITSGSGEGEAGEDMDIVEVMRRKREGKREGTEEQREEKEAKRRKKREERGDDEDVFGGSLRNV